MSKTTYQIMFTVEVDEAEYQAMKDSMPLPLRPPEDEVEALALNGMLCSALELVREGTGETVRLKHGAELSLPLLEDGVRIHIPRKDLSVYDLQVTVDKV